MRKLQLLICLLVSSLLSDAAGKDSIVRYSIPDTMKAFTFLADIRVQSVDGKKEVRAGIRTDLVSLALEADKKEKEIVFEFPGYGQVMSNGIGVEPGKGELEWEFDWKLDETYKLMLSIATDSAGNFLLYSGYIFLPAESKWKLIGTCKINGQWNTIKQPASFYSIGKKQSINVAITDPWCQRQNGTWKKLEGATLPNPVINLPSHVDSAAQYQIDQRIIDEAIAAGKTDVKENVEGVYYTIINPGTGKQVSVNDTVVVHYKGYIFPNGEVFDQTKEKPATFPLKRLIRGWQIGIPLLKVGGKIKLVIPSAHGYSIRPRASKIPPNSILVFEVEVLEARN